MIQFIKNLLFKRRLDLRQPNLTFFRDFAVITEDYCNNVFTTDINKMVDTIVKKYKFPMQDNGLIKLFILKTISLNYARTIEDLESKYMTDDYKKEVYKNFKIEIKQIMDNRGDYVF
jgi:hypothetical protein